MKQFKWLLGLFLLLMVSAVSGEEVTIFANDDYRPVSYKNERGEAVGVAQDLLKYHEQLTKESLNVEMSTWRRAYELALKGRGGVIGLSKTPERLAIFDYSEPFMEDVVGVVVRKDRVFPFHLVADLKGKTVGITNGASYGVELDRAIAQQLFRVDYNYSTSTRLKKVLHQRVDCALLGGGNEALALAVKSDPELFANRDQFIFLSTAIAVDPLYLGFHKSMKMTKFLQRFNQTIKKARVKGLLKNTKH
ncbi:MAG: transporter substrate-binding domain-containing protein [Burkholderiales bacterium]|nr:transporter substrate-binding domain-containing protein [Burkholderiales bacterium]